MSESSPVYDPAAQPPCCEAAAGDGGHDPWRPLYGGLLKRCERCGLVATHEVPDFAYEAGYFDGKTVGGYDFDSAFARALDAARFQAELSRLEKQGLRGTVLDVGCATGAFLAHAQSRGWEVAGVEVAESARRRAERDLNAPIARSLDELEAQAAFDVLTLHHVVEHIPEPLAFLRQLRPRVKRRLLIELPNFASLASRVHGPQWRDLRPDQHVYHYVPATLRRLAEAAGYTIVRTYTLWESLWSLRTALDVLRLLPGLVRSPRHQAFPRRGTSEGLGPDGGGPTAVCDVSDYRPPTGAKRVATAVSRIALAPIVAALEAAGLGERLVLEAEPIRTGPE
ncbi:MAG: class I SAM-dependent methyltransferase [bacterium]|nr:class I SAM-dependent methyltransferase [bacterium]